MVVPLGMELTHEYLSSTAAARGVGQELAFILQTPSSPDAADKGSSSDSPPEDEEQEYCSRLID